MCVMVIEVFWCEMSVMSIMGNLVDAENCLFVCVYVFVRVCMCGVCVCLCVCLIV